MNTMYAGYVDHRREDDSAAFALLTASFALAVIAVLALFALRIVPTNFNSAIDTSSVTLSVSDAETVINP